MNCRDRQHDIVLFLYEELENDARQDLRGHLDECSTCLEFYAREKQMQVELTEDFSDWEVPADLLVECRRELTDELDRVELRRSWWKPSGFVSRMRLLESAAMLSVGLAAGVYVTNHLDTALPPTDDSMTAMMAMMAMSDDAAVANLRIIGSDLASGQIELAGEMVQPMRVEGSIQDENVRQLIFGAMQSQSNPGFRLRAVELLAQNSRDPNIKEVLVGTLLNDDNAGVRLYALQALQAFSEEEDVRQALKYVVATDDTPGIRVQALDALAPMSEEEAMAAFNQEAVRENPNEYIQMRELQFVGAGTERPE